MTIREYYDILIKTCILIGIVWIERMKKMKIMINGEAREIESQVSIIELLKIADVKMPEMVSVEVNGEIIDRDDFENILLKENDEVEFLYFMGGGANGLE